MQFRYFATNKIPVDSQEAVKGYLSLCLSYFRTPIDPYCTTPPKYTREINEDTKKIAEVYEDSSKLSNNFEVTQLEHIGFLVKIGYGKKENSFKLRMFYEKSLEEKNLDVLFDPIMTHLTTGPNQLGLKVDRINERLGGIEHPISYDEVKEHLGSARVNYLLNKTKELNKVLKVLDKKMDRAEKRGSNKYHSLLEERNYESDSKKRYEGEIKRILIANHYLGRYKDYKEILRQKTEIFEKVRERFSNKMPYFREDMEKIAFGTFPYLHNEVTQPHFGQLINLAGLLPFNKELSFLGGKSLIEAEIFEKPVKNLEWAVSLFPYTSHIPLVNELTENLLKDEEMITAMIAHELGESVAVEMFGLPCVNILARMSDSFYAWRAREEEKRADEMRHEHIDALLENLGYGGANNKLKEHYLKIQKELKANCNRCGKNYLLSGTEDLLSDEQWNMHFNHCFESICEKNPFKLQDISSK